MPAGTLAKKYAAALFAAALERGDNGPEAVKNSLLPVRHRLAGTTLSALLSPTVSKAEKNGLLLSLAGAGAPEEAGGFLSLLLEKKRLALFPDILDVFSVLCEEHRGIKRADILSAHEMDNGTKEKIRGVLEKRYQKKFVLNFVRDPEMIGGLSIKIGNDLVDGSVRNRLAEIKTALNA